MQLRRLQERFWSLITAPTSVGQALPELARRMPDLVPVRSWIVANEEAQAIAGLDVYGHMYFFRLHDILVDDFPKVAKLVGAESFHDLVTDYLIAHPSTQPSVRHVGAEFAAFLSQHEQTRSRQDVVDLARLEWARIEVFDAAEETQAPIDRNALVAVEPALWPELRLTTIQAVRLLRLQSDAPALWRALGHTTMGENQAAQAEAATALHETFVLVYRRDLVVYHQRLDGGAASLFEGMQRQIPFGPLCAEIAHALEKPEQAVAWAASCLAGFVDEGLIANLHRGG